MVSEYTIVEWLHLWVNSSTNWFSFGHFAGSSTLIKLNLSRNFLEKFFPPLSIESSTTTVATTTNQAHEDENRKTKLFYRSAGTEALKKFFTSTTTISPSTNSTQLAPSTKSLLTYPSCPLIDLNLSSMKLGDNRGEYLACSLTYLPYLKILNLSKATTIVICLYFFTTIEIWVNTNNWSFLKYF